MSIYSHSNPYINHTSPEQDRLFTLTSLVGREQETAKLQQLLVQSDIRLLTITGPGGVGKTSLALQVARESGNNFAKGIFFIFFSAIRDPTLVIPTIAQSLGIAESPDQLLFERLKDFLRDQQMLFLLDNFEQLIAAAPLLTELLVATEKLKILVTSREVLNLRGEQEFPLRPLKFFEQKITTDQPSVEILSKYASIRLLVMRAQASQSDFELTSDNAMAIAGICARLDGLPLAIELAAARIKLFPPQAMLEQLQKSSLHLLSGGGRDAPRRQKTLRDTIQWSYDLLDEDEQRLFRTLSVFVGGCTIEAAGAFSRELGLSPFDLLTSLVDKNLVCRNGTDSQPRLSMLETIREYGLEQLAQTKELESARYMHAHYYLSLAEQTEPYLTGREQKNWLQQLECEQDNFRAALHWGFTLYEADQRAEFALRLAGALWQFWHLRGQWSEGRSWLEKALSTATKSEVNSALLAKALYATATLMRYQYEFPRAQALCEQSIKFYRALDDKEGLLTALLQSCRILDYQGDDAAVQSLLPEALALAEGLGDVPIKAEFYTWLPIIVQDGIRSGMATRYLEESERIYRLLDDPAGLATTLILQGGIADLQGDTKRGQVLRHEARRLSTEVDDHLLRIIMLAEYAYSAWWRGDDDMARRQIDQILTTMSTMDSSSGQGDLFVIGHRNLFFGVLAAILHHQGLSIWAARVYGLADKLAKKGESLREGGEVINTLRKRAVTVRAEVQARLGDEAFTKALAEGHTMTVKDLLAIPQPAFPSSSSPRPSLIQSEALTRRELEVLHLLAQDFSNPQIADHLVVSRRTVEAHLRSIYGKFGVKSRDAAIRYAIEHGIVEE